MTDASLLPILSMVLRERQWPVPTHLAEMARHLPPVAAAGLEFALGVDAPADLQQRIRPGAETTLLRAWLDRLSLPAGSPWSRLRAFLAAGEFETAADELWLELDARAEAETCKDPPAMSLFLRLRDRGLDPSEVVRRLIAGVDATLSTDAGRALDGCLSALPGGARLSYLGLMLGRPRHPLRLIIDALPADAVGDFLAAAGLPGIAAECQHQADSLSGLFDRFRLALTVTDRLEPAIGFECFIGGLTGNDPRWRAVFSRLVAQGRCLPDYPDRLAGWPGSLLPFQVAGGWPGPLIAQALARGSTRLGWLDCRISHVKVSDRGTVKAYIGVLEQERAALPDQPVDRGPARPEICRSPAAMRQRALDFLLGNRSHTGWWLDYDGFREGISDEWLTAYVGCAVLSAGATAAACRAWMLLSERVVDTRQGWGWNLLQPADADSTIWALRLAQSLDRLSDMPARQGLAFLNRHIDAVGAVSTYLPGSHDPAGINPDWSRPHDCVTAACAGLKPMAARVIPALLAAQRPDGSWAGYWWADPAYPTALAAAALAASAPDPAVLNACGRAAALARRRLVTENVEDAFTLALLLRTAWLMPDMPTDLMADTVERLARLQRPDGSWPGSARMLISNHRRELVPAVDRAGIFTTATVLVTLSALAAQEVLP